MRDYCPKCEADLTQFLCELELGDEHFVEYEKTECPYCGAKLKVKLETSFYVIEDEGENDGKSQTQP